MGHKGPIPKDVSCWQAYRVLATYNRRAFIVLLGVAIGAGLLSGIVGSHLFGARPKFDEVERMMIYWRVCLTQDFAVLLAREKYPQFDLLDPRYRPETRAMFKKRIVLQEEVAKRLQYILGKEFDISEKDFDRIAVEGDEKLWPLPHPGLVRKLFARPLKNP